MIIREQLYKIADQLALNASIEDVIDRLLLLYKVETGLKQADEGKVIPHSEVEQRVEKWLK
jgi:predicted transcriptional regulator